MYLYTLHPEIRMAAQNLYDICKIHENIQHVKRTPRKGTSFFTLISASLYYFFKSRAALMRPLNKGWALVGRDLNSGWNWQPTNQG